MTTMSASVTQIHTLHRYFIWADRMKTHFYDHLRSSPGGPHRDPETDIDGMMYMSMWYAELFVVVEGWQKLNLTDPRVGRFLDGVDNAAMLKGLRRYRNAIFHFQPDYWTKKLLGLIGHGGDSATWVVGLHQALGDSLRERLQTAGS